ncbi:MAG: hypothetical protein ACE5J9_02310 [Methanosarcinales archaeon]
MVFLEGYITSNLEPKIKNIFLIGTKDNIELETMLDTCFNGEFCLPRKYKDSCELQVMGSEKFELADGSIVEQEIYFGQILINNQPYFVEICLTDAEGALIGMGLLQDKIAVFDLKKNKIVVE